MGSSGNKRCGILSGIFGSLVTLGIGIVIGLYAIGESIRCYDYYPSVQQGYSDVGVNFWMSVTSFDVGRWMLVTNMAKTLTNILKL